MAGIAPTWTQTNESVIHYMLEPSVQALAESNLSQLLTTINYSGLKMYDKLKPTWPRTKIPTVQQSAFVSSPPITLQLRPKYPHHPIYIYIYQSPYEVVLSIQNIGGCSSRVYMYLLAPVCMLLSHHSHPNPRPSVVSSHLRTRNLA